MFAGNCVMYTGGEWCHRSTVVIINLEHTKPSPSASTVEFEHVFIFCVWLFYISIVFRLTLISLGFLRVVIAGGCQFDPPSPPVYISRGTNLISV